MKILIACSAGITTEDIEKVVKEHITKNSLNDEVKALPIDVAKVDMFKYDVILLSPQEKYMLENFQKQGRGIPVAVISIHNFALMKGENIYNQAKELFDGAKE